MAGLAEDQGTKRKRVFRACDSCRAMKSKCDGARPACGRCTGYGYKCLYGFAGKRNQSHRLGVAPDASRSSPSSHDSATCSSTIAALQLTARDYSNLVRAVLPTLPETERPAAEEALHKLDERVREAQLTASTRPSPRRTSASKSPKSASTTRRNTAATSVPRPVERYLGEVSDVRFFNLVDRALAEPSSHSPGPSGHPGHANHAEHGTTTAVVVDDGDALESYEQDDPSPEAAAAHDDAVVEFPGADVAGRYLDIYFSTIHVAYPFLPRALFMKSYERYLSNPQDTNDTWLATMYTLVAIGAYYDMAASSGEGILHEQYYRHALALASTSSTDTLDRSLHQVSFLLAQCFYLLAVCRTDKCWTTLGLAVRVAQSIGLHVDSDTAGGRPDAASTSTLAFRNAELRRRVWYSVYVLDRLLALQLGRPPAIHDEDCHLRLPSRLGDEDMDWLGMNPVQQQQPDPTAPTVGDYFVCMIALSKIIGYVLRDLYSPRGRSGLQGANGDDNDSGCGGGGGGDNTLTGWLLPSTKRLDRQLLEWRRTLPRKLRFDFGHAFDAADASPVTSAIFKRQRNMLAVKFHHLRAVIHRPYLCLPLLHREDPSTVAPNTGHADVLRRYETTCILEARASAHLLHNVVDKQNLVHDFPWWQMISCLVYASSILVVASAFARRRNATADDDVDTNPTDVMDIDAADSAALEDDAETCLTVFEALSPSSESARLARDMMRRLKARGAAWREVHGRDIMRESGALRDAVLPTADASVTGLSTGQGPTPPTYTHPSMTDNVGPQQPPNADFVPLPTPMQTDALTAWPLPQEWPLEILDSMEWSTQFFNTVEGGQYL